MYKESHSPRTPLTPQPVHSEVHSPDCVSVLLCLCPGRPAAHPPRSLGQWSRSCCQWVLQTISGVRSRSSEGQSAEWTAMYLCGNIQQRQVGDDSRHERKRDRHRRVLPDIHNKTVHTVQSDVQSREESAGSDKNKKEVESKRMCCRYSRNKPPARLLAES